MRGTTKRHFRSISIEHAAEDSMGHETSRVGGYHMLACADVCVCVCRCILSLFVVRRHPAHHRTTHM